jgi:lipid-A-disaccharide synthase
MEAPAVRMRLCVQRPMPGFYDGLMNPMPEPESRETAMMPGGRKRIVIVAGEASADRYGAQLVSQLHAMHGEEALEFFGAGGDGMADAGVRLLGHIRDLAHIGVREALSGLKTYHRVYRSIIGASREKKPDLAVLLDFPEFNLRLARKMKRNGIPVVYYISPQIWAWRSSRIRSIRKYVDKMLVILPFEEEYYKKRGVAAEFVGHPLLEGFYADYDRRSFLERIGLDPARKTVAILAGSRDKEIEYILPPLLQAARLLRKRMPVQFLISAAPSVGMDKIRNVAERVSGDFANDGEYRFLAEDARSILANSDFAFVKSGTSSLEAALVGTPFVVTYKISSLSWFIGTLLIRTPMLGLVNLIAQERIVPEFYQKRAKPEALAGIAAKFLEDPREGESMRARLSEIHKCLSSRRASEAAALAVSSFLQTT